MPSTQSAMPGIHDLRLVKARRAPELGLARVPPEGLAQVGYTRLAMTSSVVTRARIGADDDTDRQDALAQGRARRLRDLQQSGAAQCGVSRHVGCDRQDP